MRVCQRSLIASTTLFLCLITGLTGCVIDPNAPSGYPPQRDDRPSRPAPSERKFVKYIQYSKGQVSYFRTDRSPKVADSNVRICFENNTGQPKAMQWTKMQSGVNAISVPKNGSRDCVTVRANQRIEWLFKDRGLPVKAEAMNLQSFAGALVEFIWVKDY